MRSMFGVRYPMMPLLFALMLNQPMSSPQMIRMFGFSVFAMYASRSCVTFEIAARHSLCIVGLLDAHARTVACPAVELFLSRTP